MAETDKTDTAAQEATKQAAAEEAAVKKAFFDSFKGKPYHEIAAHHDALRQAGKYDEAAEFHHVVVRNFKKKPAK